MARFFGGLLPRVNGQLSFVISGGDSVITTGLKGGFPVPYAMTVQSWTIFADDIGDIVVDIWKDSYANLLPTVEDSIAGSEKPTLDNAKKNQNLAVTTWTPALAAGDILVFNVDSVATVTWVSITLSGPKV